MPTKKSNLLLPAENPVTASHEEQRHATPLSDGWMRTQEFSLTPIMWQMVDVARWLDPRVHVFTVVHSPRARPNLEERGLLRALSEVSDRLIVMSW